MRAEDRQRAASRLFDAVGQVEDRWIAEAETPYVPTKARGFALRRGLILALVLMLSVASVLGTLMGRMAQDEEAEAPNDAGLEQVGSTAVLSTQLSELRASTEGLRVDDPDLFSGTPQIIWKYRDEAGYRVKTISDAEQTELTRMMQRDPGTAVSPTAAQGPLEGIWLAYGDGTVVTPCLRQSQGNAGYGQIFAYEPELEPSAAFTDTLCGIIS